MYFAHYYMSFTLTNKYFKLMTYFYTKILDKLIVLMLSAGDLSQLVAQDFLLK